eukprot:364897-Chlamydomonas_euryale.AAC.6
MSASTPQFRCRHGHHRPGHDHWGCGDCLPGPDTIMVAGDNHSPAINICPCVHHTVAWPTGRGCCTADAESLSCGEVEFIIPSRYCDCCCCFPIVKPDGILPPLPRSVASWLFPTPRGAVSAPASRRRALLGDAASMPAARSCGCRLAGGEREKNDVIAPLLGRVPGAAAPAGTAAPGLPCFAALATDNLGSSLTRSTADDLGSFFTHSPTGNLGSFLIRSTAGDPGSTLEGLPTGDLGSSSEGLRAGDCPKNAVMAPFLERTSTHASGRSYCGSLIAAVTGW